MKPEEYLERNLIKYLKEGRKGMANGVSQIQITCKVGYNQACHTVEYGIKKGVLVKDSEKEFLHWIIES